MCPLSQKEITSLAGTCRETVFRTLNKFKKEKVLKIERSNILILDIKGLKRRALQDSEQKRAEGNEHPLPK
jgi:hypothetical protein